MNETAPYLLHIETTGLTCGVAVSRERGIIAEFAVNQKNVHSRKLAPFVEQALEEAEISPDVLSAIVVSAGPGSFTGLRIGFSLAKGMAQALNIPVIPVSTLQVWAYSLGPRPEAIVPIIDARREELFVARFHHDANGFQEVEKPTLLPLAEFPNWLGDAPAIITGADAVRLKSQLHPLLPDSATIWSAPQPQMWALAELGYSAYLKGNWPSLTDAEPLYMRAFKGVL